MREIEKLKRDPYLLEDSTVKDPPLGFFKRLNFLGPGLILTAGIVGSGELIATTTLGAEVGFVLLWIIIISCVIKVALQLVYGRAVIDTGEPTMTLFNRFPGPKLGSGNWSIWTWLLIMIIVFFQSSGIMGGVAITIQMVLPDIRISIILLFVGLSVSLLIYKGYYQIVEKVCLILILLFTVLTVFCVAALQFTPYAVSWRNILNGFEFRFPKGAVGIAIAAFGITGVGADEILYYGYWCLEKGYASFAGSRHDSNAWIKRAKGWVGVI